MARRCEGLAIAPCPQPQSPPALLKLTRPPPAQLDLRTNTVFEIVGHPDGSTLNAQGLSRIFDLDYKAALTLKNVTLVNGRAADGGAIRGRSRFPPGIEVTGPEAMAHSEPARLAIMGGAIRDCEATNDGGAIALIGESGSMMGAGAVEVPPPPPGALVQRHGRVWLTFWHDAKGLRHACTAHPFAQHDDAPRFPSQESTPSFSTSRSADAGQGTKGAPSW